MKAVGEKATNEKSIGNPAGITKDQLQTNGKAGEEDIAMIGIMKAATIGTTTVRIIPEETITNNPVTIILNTEGFIIVLRITRSFLEINTENITIPGIVFTGIAMESDTVFQNRRETSITGIYL